VTFYPVWLQVRGLRRANATLARLGRSTGLHDCLGELDVEVLSNETCDAERWATVLGWHEKYERMWAVFCGAKDGEVEGYRFTLMLNCRSGPPHARTCVPVSVASVTPHRVYNKQEGSAAAGHWHVELELQTLLVPTEHQGKGIGTVMQRAMYVLACSLAAEPDPPYGYDDDGPDVWQPTGSPWIGRRVARDLVGPGGDREGSVVRGVVEAWLPAADSGFLDDKGLPAPLWRLRYTSSGPLEGQLEDLEEGELKLSVPPDNDPTSSSGAGGATAASGGGSSAGPAASAPLLQTNRAEALDGEEAAKLMATRITCMTTVYLDNMARRFYLKNGMKDMLPPYVKHFILKIVMENKHQDQTPGPVLLLGTLVFRSTSK